MSAWAQEPAAAPDFALGLGLGFELKPEPEPEPTMEPVTGLEPFLERAREWGAWPEQRARLPPVLPPVAPPTKAEPAR